MLGLDRATRPTPLMGFLLRYFLRGLLVVIPAAATIWILVTVFLFVDDLVRLPLADVDQEELNLGIDLTTRGVGFVLTLVMITLIGFLTSNFFTRWIFGQLELLFTKVPVVKLVYNSIKDVIEAFLSEKKKFDKPVLLTLAEDVQVIGFVTRESLTELGLEGKVAVYVPQSYNFAANLIVVPSERVSPLDANSADVMAFVVSGGVSEAVIKNGAKS